MKKIKFDDILDKNKIGDYPVTYAVVGNKERFHIAQLRDENNDVIKIGISVKRGSLEKSSSKELNERAYLSLLENVLTNKTLNSDLDAQIIRESINKQNDITAFELGEIIKKTPPYVRSLCWKYDIEYFDSRGIKKD